ncbi:hypothetical protein ScPMuIL_007652 [Solemya velum]
MTSLCIKLSLDIQQHEIESPYLQMYQAKLSCLFQSLNTLYKWITNMYTPHSATYLFRPSSASVSLSPYPPSTVPESSIKSAISQTRAPNHTTSSTIIDLGKSGLSLRNVLQNVGSISELHDIVSCVSNATSFSSKSRPSTGNRFVSESRNLKAIPISSDTCLTQNACNRNNPDEISNNGKDLKASNQNHVPEPPATSDYKESSRSRCSSAAKPEDGVHEKSSDSILSKKVVLAGRKHRRVKSEHRGTKSKIKLHKTGRTAAQNKSKTDSINGIYVNVQAQTKPVLVYKHVKVNSPRHNDSSTISTITQLASAFSLNAAFSSMSKPLNLPKMRTNHVVERNENLVGSDTSKNTFIFPSYPQYSTANSEVARVIKIYLSEKQSGVIRDCGMEVPCAPPATPTPEQMEKYEYVPSMNDIKAQRAVKMKLQVLEKEAQRRMEKLKEQRAKLNKQHQKEQDKQLKTRQRQEIYALNKVMTELENSRFLEFCRTKGLNT